MRGSRALIGATLAFSLGCAGVQQPQPIAPPPLASPGAPATSPTPHRDDPSAAGPDPFVLPVGPRDELAIPVPQPLRLDAWDAAVKARGVAPARA